MSPDKPPLEDRETVLSKRREHPETSPASRYFQNPKYQAERHATPVEKPQEATRMAYTRTPQPPPSPGGGHYVNPRAWKPETAPPVIVNEARNVRDQAIPGTVDHNLREAKCAELEQRPPRYSEPPARPPVKSFEDMNPGSGSDRSR